MGNVACLRCLRTNAVFIALLAVAVMVGACGQAEPLPNQTNKFGTPISLPTATSVLNTPQVAATQTAFAAIPTKGDTSPFAPTIEATLSLPTPTYNPGPQTRPTQPIPTFPTRDPSAPCILGVNASSPGLQVQVPSSQIIILGTITELLPARWSTPDGQRPSNPCGVVQPPFPYIYTPVRVTVEQVLKGTITTTEIEVQLLGGTVGQDRRFNLSEAPAELGQRAVLFISMSGASSISGRYIVTNGNATEAVPPSRTVPLQQLISEIMALLPSASPSPVATPATPTAGP